MFQHHMTIRLWREGHPWKWPPWSYWQRKMSMESQC
jgi:hypothetical protein